MNDNNQINSSLSPSRGYKKTGKNVTVSKDDLVNAMLERLMDYDSMTPSQKSEMINPYNDPINVKVGGNKMVQVPRYVQNIAINKWLSLKRRADMTGIDSQQNVNSSHTRIANRTRYASQDRDPFVMNRELRGVQGAMDDDKEMNEFTDYPIDRELKKLYDYEKSSRYDVGGSRIPDDRYGRGGSYGDLPRDFEIFSRGVQRNLDDLPYVDGASESGAGNIEPNGFYEQHDFNDLNYLSDYDDNLKRTVRQRDRQSGPQIRGMDPDIHSEKQGIETPGIEHYAPVDFSEDSTSYQVNNYEGDCVSCSKGGDGDRFRSNDREYRDYKPMYDRKSSRNGSDMDDSDMDGYEFDYDDQDGDNGADSPVYENEGRFEYMDDSNHSNESTYKYLFIHCCIFGCSL
jgi:hypothetical protein